MTAKLEPASTPGGGHPDGAIPPHEQPHKGGRVEPGSPDWNDASTRDSGRRYGDGGASESGGTPARSPSRSVKRNAFAKGSEAARLAGAKGGRATAERRRRERERSGLDAYLELVDSDPDSWARSMMRSSNALAHARLVELARSARRERVEVREQELDEREAELAEREQAWEMSSYMAEVDERERDRVVAERDALRAEVAELERARDELRSAILAEADAAGMEPDEEDEGS